MARKKTESASFDPEDLLQDDEGFADECAPDGKDHEPDEAPIAVVKPAPVRTELQEEAPATADAVPTAAPRSGGLLATIGRLLVQAGLPSWKIEDAVRSAGATPEDLLAVRLADTTKPVSPPAPSSLGRVFDGIECPGKVHHPQGRHVVYLLQKTETGADLDRIVTFRARCSICGEFELSLPLPEEVEPCVGDAAACPECGWKVLLDGQTPALKNCTVNGRGIFPGMGRGGLDLAYEDVVFSDCIRCGSKSSFTRRRFALVVPAVKRPGTFGDPRLPQKML